MAPADSLPHMELQVVFFKPVVFICAASTNGEAIVTDKHKGNK